MDRDIGRDIDRDIDKNIHIHMEREREIHGWMDGMGWDGMGLMDGWIIIDNHR